MQAYIRGKRIIIKKPVIKKESLIEFTPNMEAEYEKDMMMKYTRLEVTAVGSDVTDIKPGDLVYVGAAIAHSEVIQIEEDFFFIVPEHAVSLIWK
jgi:hypothetical protein